MVNICRVCPTMLIAASPAKLGRQSGVSMRFGILGSLEIQRDDGTHTVIRQARIRSLLTVMLANHGQVLSTDQLGFLVWGINVPAKAEHAIHAYMSMLRRELGSSDVIRNVRPGYRLDLAPHFLDVDEFHELRAHGASAFSARDFSRTCMLLDQACGLWRNPELPDFPRSPQMKGAAAKLIAELHAVQDMLIDARLAMGQHREVIPSLRAKTLAQPEHEPAWTQLMVALYRSEMRTMALSVYLEAREALRDVSGIDPGPTMRLLHAQMLRDVPSLLWP